MEFPIDPVYGEIFKPATLNSKLAYQWNGVAWKPSKIEDIVLTRYEGAEHQFFTRNISEEVYKEEPSGEINGVNTIFVLNSSPILGTEYIFLNGLLQRRGASEDYTTIDNIIYFNFPPRIGSSLACTYSKKGYLEIRNEIPVGVDDSQNRRFRLTFTPSIDTEHVFLNGLLQRKGLDYTLENNIIIFNENLFLNTIITCDYKIMG